MKWVEGKGHELVRGREDESVFGGRMGFRDGYNIVSQTQVAYLALAFSPLTITSLPNRRAGQGKTA